MTMNKRNSIKKCFKKTIIRGHAFEECSEYLSWFTIREISCGKGHKINDFKKLSEVIKNDEA